MAENIKYMVGYRGHRYNDGSANNADLKREVEVGSAEEALKLVDRINKAAQRYKDACAGKKIEDEIDEDSVDGGASEYVHEESERYLVDWLIGGGCGGFFYPGATAYVDHIRREALRGASDGEDAG